MANKIVLYELNFDNTPFGVLLEGIENRDIGHKAHHGEFCSKRMTMDLYGKGIEWRCYLGEYGFVQVFRRFEA